MNDIPHQPGSWQFAYVWGIAALGAVAVPAAIWIAVVDAFGKAGWL